MTPIEHNPVSFFAHTNARQPYRAFGIRQRDRLFHQYVIGRTGVGKSTLFETLLRQDIAAGRGCALIDPHGDLVARVAASVPEDRRADLIYLNVPDPAQPYGYNPLRTVSASHRSLVASGLLAVFKKLWASAWGVRMEYLMRNAILALLEYPGATLPDILRLFHDASFRNEVVRRITNPQVHRFWRDEFERFSKQYRADSIAPIQNKVGAFLANPTLYRILTRTDGQLRFRQVMDEGKVLLINLARGGIGEDSANLLGALLVTSIGHAAFSRSNQPEHARRSFFLYVDEFQTFTTLAVAEMLSELRKFSVGMVLAHQYLHQLEPDVLHAVLGNAGTLIAFRLGAYDANIIAREFEPRFGRIDLLNLPNHHIYVKLMIDGTPSVSFSATTLPSKAVLCDGQRGESSTVPWSG